MSNLINTSGGNCYKRKDDCLKKENYLREFSSRRDKQEVRRNLDIVAGNIPYHNVKHPEFCNVKKALDYILDELSKTCECCNKEVTTTTCAPIVYNEPKKKIILIGDNLPAYTITINNERFIVRGKNKVIELNAFANRPTSYVVSDVQVHADYYTSDSINEKPYPYLITVDNTDDVCTLKPNMVKRICNTTTNRPMCPDCPRLNTMYYGTVNMDFKDFRDLSIENIMALPKTMMYTVVGDSRESIEIPQNEEIAYVLIPKSMELEKAYFTSGGITTTYYDKEKVNIPGTTNNGAFYSMLTRGGVNFNVGGKLINGEYYDVFFAYNPGCTVSEPITLTLKNK